MEYYKSLNGYCEIENETKYSIVHTPHDNCLYARGEHFGWNKVDSNYLIDYPRARIALARQQVGHEIMFTAGGHRKSKIYTLIYSIDNDSIPAQFRQSSYNNENGCVWLYACLLMYSVDTNISKVMIERYQNNKKL